MRLGWDNDDWLWDAGDDLQRGVSGGLGASLHSARAEDERGDVGVLAAEQLEEYFDRGRARLEARPDPGGKTGGSVTGLRLPPAAPSG